MSDKIDYITHRPDSLLLTLNHVYSATKQYHNYLPLYHRHFGEIRMQVKRVLEIGVESNRSVKLWKSYFPNAEIVGVDIDERCKQFEEDRIKIYIGDQGDPAFLATLPQDFDIVIDDGSHIEKHQIESFAHLFQHNMNERGIYVVEDCEGKHDTIRFFGQLTKHVNFWPPGFEAKDWGILDSFSGYSDNYLVKHVTGVSFYRYIIFVDKGRNPEDGEAAERIRGKGR